MSVKEAAATYEVSRAELHRLVQTGRLQTAKDPRDERVTLLRTDELETLFQLPAHESTEMDYITKDRRTETAEGRMTDALRERIDTVRTRVAGGRTEVEDSTNVIREARAQRSEQLREATPGGRRLRK